MKALIQYLKMKWFSSPEQFIKWYLTKNHGSVKLKDGTWAVNQTDEFRAYCYSKWKEANNHLTNYRDGK